MRYEFRIRDYDEIMYSIKEREDYQAHGFGYLRVDAHPDDNSILYAYGYRIVIPELEISVRPGVEYIGEGNDAEAIDSVIIYELEERDASNYYDSYCNISVEALIGMITRDKKKESNPLCYIDDSEFVFYV